MLQYYQFSLFHLKAERFHEVFYGMIAPPVAFNPPAQVFNAVCKSCTTDCQVSWLEEAVWIVSVSSIKEKTQYQKEVRDIGVVILLPRFADFSMSRIGVETTAQIAGPGPFPWQIPCIGMISIPPK
jgi:hypothetical protein